MTSTYQVRIAGEIFLYDEKAPYEKSGFGEYGALRLDPDTDRVMCHECGKWFENVGKHASIAHQITAREYKIKHGLKFSSALCNERCRLFQSRLATEGKYAENLRRHFSKKLHKRAVKLASAARGKNRRRLAESLNLNGHCKAQMLRDLKELAEKLGRTPTQREIEREIGVYLSSIRKAFGSVEAAMTAAGLQYRKRSIHAVPRRPRPVQFSEEQLRFMILNFVKLNGRIPVRSDCKRGLLPSPNTYKRRFGSWSNAQKIAKRAFHGPDRSSKN